MAKFRVKKMDDEEWLAFKLAYDLVYQMLGSTGDTALFCEKMAGSDETLVLIPAHRAEVIESVSPGGWQDVDETNGHNWRFIAGRNDAHATFGVQLAS